MIKKRYNKLINIVLPGRCFNIPRRDDKNGSLAMSDIIPENASRYNVPNTKRCARCHRRLPVSEYAPSKRDRSGMQSYCKECNMLHQRQMRLRMTQERKDDINLRHKFGISFRDYNRMLEAQGGVCAICKQPETHINGRNSVVQRLSVDHDHKTGDVRALLCQRCNVALGLLGEDPERIQRLKGYAEWCQTREPLPKIIQRKLID